MPRRLDEQQKKSRAALDAQKMGAKFRGYPTHFPPGMSERQAPPDDDTAPDPVAKGATAAEMSGVHMGGTGDPAISLTGLGTNVSLMVVFFAAFSILRTRIPMVYAGRIFEIVAPVQPSDSLLGWIWARLSVNMDDYVAHCGMDQAMLIEFTRFGMRLVSFVMVPLFFIMGPLQGLCGGNRSGDDRLSTLGIAIVLDSHTYLYWVHAGLVWSVVVVVQRFIYSAQKKFRLCRKDWLKGMPTLRVTTISVVNTRGEPQRQAGECIFQ